MATVNGSKVESRLNIKAISAVSLGHSQYIFWPIPAVLGLLHESLFFSFFFFGTLVDDFHPARRYY